MSTPYASASQAPAVPPTREFTIAWLAYLLFAVSAIFVWPVFIGLIICYSKRGQVATGFIDSHHRWLIRTFWYSVLAVVCFFALMLVGIWPMVADIVRQVAASGDWDQQSVSIDVDWGAIFSSVGAATLGGLGLALTWFWFIYRLIRGMFSLADARALP